MNGQLLKSPGKDTVFWIDHGHRRAVPNLKVLDRLFIERKLRESEKADEIPAGPHVPEDAKLVKSKKEPTIFMLDGGRKRAITSESAAKKYNFNLQKVKIVDKAVLGSVPLGDPFTD